MGTASGKRTPESRTLRRPSKPAQDCRAKYRPPLKKHLGTLVKLAITAVLLWLIFRNHHLGTAILPRLATMQQHCGWTLFGLAAMAVSLTLEGLRWHVLLRAQKYAVTRRQVLRITIVAHFFNLTSLGTTGGDAYRVLTLARVTSGPRVPVLVSVMLDHMLGAVGVGIVFLVCFALMRDSLAGLSNEVHAIVKGFSVFMACAVGGITLSAVLSTPRIYGWAERRHPRIMGWPPLKIFNLACDAQRRDWLASVKAVLFSIFLYLAQFLTFFCAIHAVGGAAPLLQVMGVMPMVDAAAGLPISVSGLGVREKTFETLMHAFTGMPGDVAISASLAGWLMGVFWALFGGLVFIRGTGAANSP